MLCSLNHPNIIRFLGISFHEGAILVLQDYCKQNLEEYILNKGAFKDLHLFLNMILPILETFKYLHNKNIAHRDIKPQNILIDKEENPLICDLGMAGKGENIGAIGKGSGTPGYTPPETLASSIVDENSPMSSVSQVDKSVPYDPKYWDIFR